MTLTQRRFLVYVLSVAAILLSAASLYLLVSRGSSRWTLGLNYVALMTVVFSLRISRRGVKDAT